MATGSERQHTCRTSVAHHLLVTPCYCWLVCRPQHPSWRGHPAHLWRLVRCAAAADLWVCTGTGGTQPAQLCPHALWHTGGSSAGSARRGCGGGLGVALATCLLLAAAWWEGCGQGGGGCDGVRPLGQRDIPWLARQAQCAYHAWLTCAAAVHAHCISHTVYCATTGSMTNVANTCCPCS